MAFGQAPPQYPSPAGQFGGAPQSGHPVQGRPAQGYPVQDRPAPTGRGGLVLLGLTLLAIVLLDLVVLVANAVDAGPGMLTTLMGIGDDYAVQPRDFAGFDLCSCVILAVCAIAVFTGRHWGRIAALPLVAVFGYCVLNTVASELSTHPEHGFASSPTYILLNAVSLAQVGLCAIALVAGTVAGRGAGAPSAPPQPYQPRFPYQPRWPLQ